MKEETNLTHLNADGNLCMVDVGTKKETQRIAIVQATIKLNQKTYDLISENGLPKGDVLAVSKIAGIQAAKKTAELIPLCHPVFLSFIDLRFKMDSSCHCITIEAEARTTSRTGVEMEALVAAQTACMTIYDMCKAVQRDIIITDCMLIHKSGGNSGVYNHTPPSL
jgi:cyclic pyranopterin phosphate synthase